MAALEGYLSSRNEQERALRHEPLHNWWLVFPVYFGGNIVLDKLPPLGELWPPVLVVALLLYLGGASLVQRQRRRKTQQLGTERRMIGEWMLDRLPV